MRFSVLTLLLATAVNSDSCNQKSADKLLSRVNGYHRVLEQGGVGSRFWSQSLHRDIGDPGVAMRHHRQNIRSIRVIGTPIVTKSIDSNNQNPVGRSTAYVEIQKADGSKSKAKMLTTWAWVPDSLGFYDWYLVRIDALQDVEEWEGPEDSKEKSRGAYKLHGSCIVFNYSIIWPIIISSGL